MTLTGCSKGALNKKETAITPAMVSSRTNSSAMNRFGH